MSRKATAMAAVKPITHKMAPARKEEIKLQQNWRQPTDGRERCFAASIIDFFKSLQWEKKDNYCKKNTNINSTVIKTIFSTYKRTSSIKFCNLVGFRSRQIVSHFARLQWKQPVPLWTRTLQKLDLTFSKYQKTTDAISYDFSQLWPYGRQKCVLKVMSYFLILYCTHGTVCNCLVCNS